LFWARLDTIPSFILTSITWPGEDKKHRDVLVETLVNKLLTDNGVGTLQAEAYTSIAVVKKLLRR
jgi:hypothetical protein